MLYIAEGSAMTQPMILQMGPMAASFDTELRTLFTVTSLWLQRDPDAWLAEHGGRFSIALTAGRRGVSSAQLAQLPNLKAICGFGVGYDTIDVAGAHARGIAVSTTPDVLNDCVADLALGLMIDTARKISAGDRFVRAGSWAARKPFPLGTKVSGKKLGIVGLGRIGAAIARRAGGFDMEIHYHNRHPLGHSALHYESSLIELARWSDFLVLALVGGAGTHHLISAEVLDALGPRGILINIARGTVVDEKALIAALSERRIAGAGLDVYDSEPDVPAALMAMDNVVLTPHIASATNETRRDMEKLLLANIGSFLADGKLISPLDPAAGV
jgi:hydroxypyruvate reductase